MIRIDSADGLFHDGNPSTGVKGTKVTAAWLNALQDEVIGAGGNIRTVTVLTTLLETDGVVFGNTAGGAITVHLPSYATVAGSKRYIVKNIGITGSTDLTIDAIDAKTIDGLVSISIIPGEKVELVKDGNNWQTI